MATMKMLSNKNMIKPQTIMIIYDSIKLLTKMATMTKVTNNNIIRPQAIKIYDSIKPLTKMATMTQVHITINNMLKSQTLYKY